MYQIYPDEGLVFQLRNIVGPDVHYHLFTNSLVPDRDTVLADLTEAAWTGYSVVTVTEPDFTLDGVAGHVGYIQAPPIAFLNSSGGDVDAYGYYVTDTSDTMLVAIGRFDSAPITKGDGESFVVVPVWGDSSVQPA